MTWRVRRSCLLNSLPTSPDIFGMGVGVSLPSRPLRDHLLLCYQGAGQGQTLDAAAGLLSMLGTLLISFTTCFINLVHCSNPHRQLQLRVGGVEYSRHTPLRDVLLNSRRQLRGRPRPRRLECAPHHTEAIHPTSLQPLHCVFIQTRPTP